jgi:cell wall-associated NlpC family hydrolase
MPLRRKKRSVRLSLVGSALGGGLSAIALQGAMPVQLSGAEPAAASTATAPVADGIAEADGSLWSMSGSWTQFGHLAAPVVGWVPRPGGGAWEVAADGGVFSRGGAPFYGGLGGRHLSAPIVGIAATPSGRGYWLVGRDGGVFAFGDARYHGGTAEVRLQAPIVGMAPTPDGSGYWLVGADGGVFSFGDARFHGGTGGVRLARPVVGIAATGTGNGYWLVGADGGVFSFGDARYAGSASGRGNMLTLSVTADGTGYDVVCIDGSIWEFRPATIPVEQHVAIPKIEVATAEAAASAATTQQRGAQIRARAVTVALSEVGKPYVYGAVGPSGFDCSGLTEYAYGQAGISLPHNTVQQFEVTAHIGAAQLQPGDLVFFYSGLSHVGVYLGNGQMVDAPHSGASVRVEAIQWFGPITGASDPAL